MTNLLKTILVCVTLSTLSISSAYAGKPKGSPNNKPAAQCVDISKQGGNYNVRNKCNRGIQAKLSLEKDGKTKTDTANIQPGKSTIYQGYTTVLLQSARYL